MFLDALLKVSAAQQVTATAASGNTVDSGSTTPTPRWGVGEPLGIGFFITAVGTNTGSLKIQAIQSAATNLGTPDIVGEVDLATADLATGKAYFVALPEGGIAAKRYRGGQYTVTGTVDATFDAYIMPASLFAQLAENYAKNQTVS